MRGEQLSRQWKLIQLLAKAHYGVVADSLADELECNRRTIYRDLDALMFAGFPITSERRAGRVFYRVIDGFRLGDTPFTPDELLALGFSEDLLRSLEGTVFHDSIESALAKIRASLGPELADFLARLRESFRVLPGPHKNYADLADVIRTLNEAVLARRTVRMKYTTARTGETAARAFDPYRVWYRNGGLYAIGHDHKSGELRTFAIDRIKAPELTPQRFTIPADFDFEARAASAFGVVIEPPERVRIRFAARRAFYVREHDWHPSQKIVRLANGEIELGMDVGTGDELASWVLSFGADAEVLEPATLRAQVASELLRARTQYGEPARARRKR
ncbi:MAG TPA: WYL domain-containing protein [Myxococcota bacterium]|jgi:proteasome accessory factor B